MKSDSKRYLSSDTVKNLMKKHSESRASLPKKKYQSMTSVLRLLLAGYSTQEIEQRTKRN